MMKSLSVCALIFFVMTGIALGQAKVQSLENIPSSDILAQGLSSPNLFSPDSLQPSNLRKPIDNMPIYNPRNTGAKMLFWWPKEEYSYGMPNMLDKKQKIKVESGKDDQKKKR